MTFDYLKDRIRKASIRTDPFKHIYIENFLNSQHLKLILQEKSMEVQLTLQPQALRDRFFEKGWVQQTHPGCYKSIESYVFHRVNRSAELAEIQGTRGMPLLDSGGLAFRLQKTCSLLAELLEFFKGDQFLDVLRECGFVSDSPYICDTGFQKYLTGYEISPHPDTRNKALTWMLNLNPPNLEFERCHTHFLKFKPRYQAIETYWAENEFVQRYWVPWNWCSTHFTQNQNNSITIFAPANDTLHAVKCQYNDSLSQRTQLYGNLWHLKDNCTVNDLTFEKLLNVIGEP